jgi:hypothetical protein
MGPRQDMIDIQIFALMGLSAILTGEAVTQENILPGQLHFLLGKTVKKHKNNDLGNPDLKINGVDTFAEVCVLGSVLPFLEIEGLVSVGSIDNMGLSQVNEGKSPFSRAYVHRLPEAVEHEHRGVN